MATYFEIHYYDGGLNTVLVPGGSRPEILPKPLGPQSTEVELRQGEIAVELFTTARKDHKIVWIGLYTFSIDKQHGARGNYCGAGVWLVDAAPIYVDRLLQFLNPVAQEVSKNAGPNEVMLADLEQKAIGFDDFGLSVPFEKLPGALWAARFDPATAGGTDYFTTGQDNTLDLDLVAADILLQFSRQPREGDDRAQRRLYCARRSSKLSGTTLRILNSSAMQAANEQAIADFCRATAEPIAEQNRLIESQRKAAEAHTQELAAARNALEAQRQQSARLQADLAMSDGQRAEMQSAFDAVSRYMSKDGGNVSSPRPASTDLGRLDDIYRIVLASQTKLGEMDRHVGRLRVRREEGAAKDSSNGAWRRFWPSGGMSLKGIMRIAIPWLVVVAVIVFIWWVSYGRYAHGTKPPVPPTGVSDQDD